MPSSWKAPDVLSYPVKVIFAGWESDTLRLQQSGWNLSVRQRPDYLGYELAITNQTLGLYAFSDESRFDGPFYQHGVPPSGRDLVPFIIRQVVNRGSTIMTMDMTVQSVNEFSPIDARPMVNSDNFMKVEDLNIWRPLAEEIYVEEVNMTVLDHLQAIKDLQAPDQARIRERVLRDREAEVVTHANIVSLRSA